MNGDPQDARIGPPLYGDQTPEGQGTGPGILDKDQELCKAKDFMGFKTSRDSGRRGIQGFAGSGNSWDSRLRRT